MTIQKQGAPARARPAPVRADAARITTKQQGDAAEQAALEHLQGRGLRLLQRNFRTPGRGGGEIDLIMRDADGTLVFVEVRQRSGAAYGGAAGSIGAVKQRRIVFAARHFLARLPVTPPCRFDVVLVQGRVGGASPAAIDWLRGAFDASGWA
ncbi:YraN family protein [Hydrogenophaga aquatica]